MMNLQKAALAAIVFGAAVSCASLASAEKLSYTDVAHQLGNVIASEEPCELSYNQDAIARFIEENVSDSEMGFASMLSLMTNGASVSIGQLTPSGKTAHCTQIRRVAKKYGFVE